MYDSKTKWQMFCESFRAEARWAKSVQHLRDNGELENEPRDIGKLIKAIKDDITEEEKENIRKFLWKEFKEKHQTESGCSSEPCRRPTRCVLVSLDTHSRKPYLLVSFLE